MTTYFFYVMLLSAPLSPVSYGDPEQALAHAPVVTVRRVKAESLIDCERKREEAEAFYAQVPDNTLIVGPCQSKLST